MPFFPSFAASAEAVVALGLDAERFDAMSDTELMDAHSTLVAHQQQTQLSLAALAGEIARRSPRDGGHSGLAQRQGFGSPESLIVATAPVSRSEASRMVEIGRLMTAARDAAAAEHAGNLSAPSLALPGWQRALAAHLSDGSLSVAASDVIRRGLMGVDDLVPAAQLESTSAELIALSREVSLGELFRATRSARDRLDSEGVADREQRQRERRSFTRWVRNDGMYQGSFLLDPENGRAVFAALDEVIAPRRGGPRFIDEADQARSKALVDDPRTDPQLLADAFVEIVRIAVEADTGRVFGSRRPAVRVVVTESTLRGTGGHGYLEGDGSAVSRATVDRHICDTGMIGITFEAGQPLDVGSTQRLFTERQRMALAIRDGGCRFPGCDRPPSWCEAHHIDQWHRDGGRTDVADGILLCRHHHMLIHDRDWTVVRQGAEYALHEGAVALGTARVRPMPSRSALARELSAVVTLCGPSRATPRRHRTAAGRLDRGFS
ncbi:MAG TPA: DUF222 domain-containing protein [Pseudolysinimonas sp.]|nr:DUF222 domain-containing protein [Pseudolysinimonas sp.]